MNATLRLIADDLSGALDALVRFAAPTAGRSLTVSWSDDPGHAAAWCSDSRDVDEAVAVERAGRSAAWLLDAQVSLLKCDSRLRGHVIPELVACLGSGDVARTVFTPALPSQGRRFHDGRVYTHPVDDAPGVDPAGPARETREPADPVVALEALGLPTSVRSPGEPVPDGISLWNASTEGDLDRIVAAAIALPGKTLWCGSSGLAGALARRDREPVHASATVPRPVPRPVLALVGTRHPVTIAQVSELACRHPGACLRAGPGGTSARTAAAQVSSALRRGESRCLSLVVPTGCDRDRAASVIESTLDDLTLHLDPPAFCLVTGGATLLVLAKLLGASTLAVEGEIESGVPVCRFGDGRWAGTRVISKSGGFGTRSLLLRALHGHA